MADHGLLRLVKSGIRFAFNKADSTYVGLKLTGTPGTSYDIIVPTEPPSSTQAMTMTSSGVIGFTALGGGGSVTSVGIAVPSDLTVSGSPVTTSGTITLARASQAANTFLGAPSGASGPPTYRTLVATDIPSITASKVIDFDAQVRLSRLDQMAVPTTAVLLNGQRIAGLADPTGAQDAATKAYVDAISQGLDVKPSVKAASTANVTITAPGVAIDGVTLTTGDRVLLKNQTTTAENGIYIYATSSTAMTRATDADTSAKVNAGMFTFAEQGTVNADSGWFLITDNPITLGTTGLTFTQFSGAGQITAGAGLTKTGNTLDVGGTTNRISVGTDSIDIDSNYVGQASITTVGIIGAGTWQGTAVAVAFGGTGANTATAARANLSAAGVARGTFTNANLTSGILTITHTLGQQFVVPVIWDDNGKKIEADDYTGVNSTTMTVDLTFAGTITGTYNFVLVG